MAHTSGWSDATCTSWWWSSWYTWSWCGPWWADCGRRFPKGEAGCNQRSNFLAACDPWETSFECKSSANFSGKDKTGWRESQEIFRAGWTFLSKSPCPGGNLTLAGFQSLPELSLPTFCAIPQKPEIGAFPNPARDWSPGRVRPNSGRVPIPARVKPARFLRNTPKA